MRGNPSVLTDAEKHQVVRWYAQFLTPNKICALIEEHFHKKFWPPNVPQLAHTQRWAPVVERYRQEWALGVFDVPIANKRFRLDALMTLFEAIQKNPKLTGERKEIRLMRLLEKARLEMEDKRILNTNVFLTSITNASDEELLKRRDELLKRIQRHPLSMRRRIADGLGWGQGEQASGSEGAESQGGVLDIGPTPGEGPVETQV